MGIRVVGAGLGRTGTNSLKVALGHLLGGRVYHMFELIERPSDTAVWGSALGDATVDWGQFLSEFAATVDWPACAFWRELAAANPDALVLLSTRDSAEEWWESADRTIWSVLREPLADDDPDRVKRRAMIIKLLETRFDPRWGHREAAMAAYERHNSAVRRDVSSARLIDWRPADGWGPICAALGVDVPQKPVPPRERCDRISRQGGAGGRCGTLESVELIARVPPARSSRHPGCPIRSG